MVRDAKRSRFLLSGIKGKIALLLASAALSVLAAEGALRVARPNGMFGAGQELPWFREGRPGTELFTIDPELGFRPVLDSRLYDAAGCWRNRYPRAKRPGVERLLFIGDSVTARAKIVEALKALYGEERFEYWNAGVESFGTVQEVEYYKRFNRAIEPDHVILTFNVNDFETTPVTYVDGKGNLVVYAPGLPGRGINRFLFKLSYLYRLYLGLRLAVAGDPESEILGETADALVDLRDTLARDGVELTILLHPILRPREEWQPFEKRDYEEAKRILGALGVRYFDLYEAFPEAYAEGFCVLDPPDDPGRAHPSAAMAERFAAYLKAHDLLAPPEE